MRNEVDCTELATEMARLDQLVADNASDVAFLFYVRQMELMGLTVDLGTGQVNGSSGDQASPPCMDAWSAVGAA